MKCFQCEDDHNDDNTIQCDGCKRNICMQCSNLTSSKVRVMGLKGRRTLLFLCPGCREALFQVPKVIKAYDGMREELDEAKKLLSQPRPTNTDSCPVLAAPAAAAPPSDTNAILEEIVERERRAHNVILVGVKECDSDNGSDRKLHDESSVKTILLGINIEADCTRTMVKVQRLGRREDGKCRPIKVVLSSRLDAVRILKNKSKAAREVRIFDDKTSRQRDELNQLRETLKKRVESGETDLTIKYVKGVPKIVHQKN